MRLQLYRQAAILLALSLCVLLPERASSQLWTYQDSPSVRNFRGVAFADSLYGVIVGDFGTLLRTTDGGTNWNELATGTTEHLRSVSLLPSGSGFIAGANGTILHTTNAFASWTVQTSGSAAFLMSVACFDSLTALAVGVGGTILHTTDAGATWQIQNSGTTVPLHSAAFRTSVSAVAVGSFGVVAQTSDGGNVWSLPSMPYQPMLNAVSFFDPLNGFIVGDGGVGYRTSDGGNVWWVTPVSARFVALPVSGPSSGAAVGSGLVLTSDDGASWSTAYVPEPFEAAAFRDGRTLFAVGVHGLVSRCLLDHADAPPVSLVFPADSATDVEMLMNETVQLGVQFRWRRYDLYRPSGIRVQVASNAGFASEMFYDGTAHAATVGDTSTVMVNLDPEKTYYWRMRAEFGLQPGPWSATWSLTPSAGRHSASVMRIQTVAAESLHVADSLQTSMPWRSGLQSSSLRDSVLLVVGVCTVPPSELRATMQSLYYDWGDWFMLADTTVDTSAWNGLRVKNSWLGPFVNDTIFWGLRVGDVVMLTGKILEDPAASMNSETYINCLTIRLLDSARAIPRARHISIGELYDGAASFGKVRYSSGEQLEGMRVELTDLSVYAPYDPTSGTMTLIGDSGNMIPMSDASPWFTIRTHRNPISTYIPPLVGTRIDTLRGILRTEGGRYCIMPVRPEDMIFGSPRTGTIGGLFFDDLNKNGIMDPGEPPMPAWRVELYGRARTTLMTDDVGRYSMRGLDSGMYAIDREPRTGWGQTTPDSGALLVHLGLNDSAGGNNFGLYYRWNTISGRVYHDLNEDGHADSTDPPLLGWMVRLNGETIDSALTDANGNYYFPFVKTGLHYVSISLKPSWEETLPVYLHGYQYDFGAFDVHKTGYDFSVHPVPARVKFRMTALNDIGTSRALWLGVRPGASYGIWGADLLSTSIDYSEGESEVPPQLEGIFDARFVDPKGSPDYFGEGSWTDIRAYTSPAEADSYKVSFLPGYFFGGNYPMTFRWSAAQVASLYAGPVLLIDPNGLVSDMKSTDSVVFADPSITTMLIVAVGPVLTVAGVPPVRNRIPERYRLGQNYPNPFNPVTTFEIELPASGPARVVIYDLLGREIAEPFGGEFQPGVYRASWDASGVPSGVYFYRLTAGTFVDTKKMLLLR